MGDKQTCASQFFLVLLTDINSLDEEALTPLHYAARYKRERQKRSSEAALTDDQEVRIKKLLSLDAFLHVVSICGSNILLFYALLVVKKWWGSYILLSLYASIVVE